MKGFNSYIKALGYQDAKRAFLVAMSPAFISRYKDFLELDE